MGLSQPGNVVVVEKKYGGMHVDVFPSIKEMVQYFLSQNASISPDGCWGSVDHLAALKETKELLERTVAGVEQELANES